MYREPGSDLIFFDEDNKRDYPALKDKSSMPADAIPGVFQDILDAQQANMSEIQKLNSGIDGRSYAEYMAAVQPYHVQSIRLQRAAGNLMKYAGTEIIDTLLGAAS